jgi:hypothetical protein
LPVQQSIKVPKRTWGGQLGYSGPSRSKNVISFSHPM